MSERTDLQISGKNITLFLGPSGSPIVYLNTFSAEEMEGVQKILREPGFPAHSLAVIGGLEWNDEMSPWYCPPVLKNGTAYQGKAGRFLSDMEEKIIPEVEEKLPEAPAYRVISGYSLAGLFAVYSLYRTDLFARAASMSGSFWYPDFLEYARDHAMKREPECLYFSLGDRESRTRNKTMKTVGDRTQALEEYFREKGINTRFEWNPGNHFQNFEERTAKGIRWVLEQPG